MIVSTRMNKYIPIDNLYEPQIGDTIQCWFAPQFKGRITYIEPKSGHTPTLYYAELLKPYPKNKFGSELYGIIFLGWQIKLKRRKRVG